MPLQRTKFKAALPMSDTRGFVLSSASLPGAPFCYSCAAAGRQTGISQTGELLFLWLRGMAQQRAAGEAGGSRRVRGREKDLPLFFFHLSRPDESTALPLARTQAAAREGCPDLRPGVGRDRPPAPRLGCSCLEAPRVGQQRIGEQSQGRAWQAERARGRVLASDIMALPGGGSVGRRAGRWLRGV